MDRISPCRQCPRGHQDKNNAQCQKCRKRLAYLQRLTRELEFSAAVTVDHGYPLHLPSRPV
jgi:hypothetical protein